MNVRNNGDFRVCCHANTSDNKGILRSNTGDRLNAGDGATFEKIRNSPILNELRSAMLRGERHEICTRCNEEDDSGIHSRRKYEQAFWSDSFGLAEAVESTDADGRMKNPKKSVGYLDLRFGNLCNLKCRMCGPTDSSRWLKEYFETKGSKFTESSGTIQLESQNGIVQIKGHNPYDWYKNPEFWREIRDNLSGLRKIYTVGGEPLLIEQHYELLNTLIEQKNAHEITIEYNSNITVVPPRALELWKNFKEIRIGASVDGLGKINDYIRYPSKWENIAANLDLLDRAEGPLRVWIATTVQAYNIFYLTDFLRWRLEKGFSRINSGARSPFLTLHPLHTPPFLSVQVLPAAVKEMTEKKFLTFFERWFSPYVHSSSLPETQKKEQIKKMEMLLQGYLSFMKKKDLSHLLPEFWKTTRRMDAYRCQDFLSVMPEIAHPIRDSLPRDP